MSAVEKDLEQAQVISLEQRFALVPLTYEVMEGIGGEFVMPLLLGEGLPDPLDELGRRLTSPSGEIAYVECESEPGFAVWQASLVWRDGEVALGPIVDPGFADEAPPHVPPPRWPINRALRDLGVESDPAAPFPSDEFETIGLSRHRLTRGWVGET